MYSVASAGSSGSGCFGGTEASAPPEPSTRPFTVRFADAAALQTAVDFEESERSEDEEDDGEMDDFIVEDEGMEVDEEGEAALREAEAAEEGPGARKPAATNSVDDLVLSDDDDGGDEPKRRRRHVRKEAESVQLNRE